MKKYVNAEAGHKLPIWFAVYKPNSNGKKTQMGHLGIAQLP